MQNTPTNQLLPYKSVAIALLFSCLLGPIGLLYASFTGGLIFIALSIFLLTLKSFTLVGILWVFSCVWAVKAVELYNRALLRLKISQL